MSRELYKTPTIANKVTRKSPVTAKTYRGLSTVDSDAATFKVYDIELIKRDIVNHFHIRYGEKLENPTFGTIIWDVLFDPLTDSLKEAIVKNVSDIINYDPRVNVDKISVNSYESGLQIECVLTYIPYSITETLQFNFDRENNLI
jgi:phage baseplate assembly protein W